LCWFSLQASAASDENASKSKKTVSKIRKNRTTDILKKLKEQQIWKRYNYAGCPDY